MKILITNDDGVYAEGINTLHEVLSAVHETYIIAPEVERSACSNAITVRSPLTVKKISEKKYAVSGYPADCVSIGLNGGIVPDADLVVSGINHGPNIGEDLFFSGTVAGARTAYIFGKSGIAVSINSYEPIREFLLEASSYILELAETIKGKSAEDESRFFLNINYPHLSKKEIKGIQFTSAGRRIYRDSFSHSHKSRDEAVMQVRGKIGSVPNPGSDITELEKGFISVTPLQTDCTDYLFLEKMQHLL